MNRPFAITGITMFLVLALLYNEKGYMPVAALAFFTLALVISLINKTVRRQSVFPIAFGAAALACLLLVFANEFYYYPGLSLSGSNHNISAVITSNSEIKRGNCYYEGRVKEIDGEKTDFKIRFTFNNSPDIEPYDTVAGEFEIYTLGNMSDDVASSYKSENMFLGAYTKTEDFHILPNQNKIKPIGFYVLYFRNNVKRAIMKILPNDYGALCTALVLGDRTALSDKAYGSLKDCGVTHIICVSGFHISIWSAALLWFLKKTGMGQRKASLFAIPLVIVLMLLAGMTFSVMRAGLMMIVYLISEVIYRKRNSLNSLGFSLTVILCFNPFAAGAVGLQLSALSTLGIILYSEYCSGAVNKFLKKHKIFSFLDKPIKILLISAVATGFCLPVTLPLYGNFNFALFPANLLIISAAEVCMITSALGAALGALNLKILNLPGFIAGLGAKYILKVTEILSKLKGLNFHISRYDSYIIISCLLVFTAVMLLIAYSGKKVMPFAPVFLSVIFVATVIFYEVYDGNLTRIRVIDTGNGEAVLISQSGENILVGCGGDSYNTEYEISKALKAEGGDLSALFIPINFKGCNSAFYSVTAFAEPDFVYVPENFDLYTNINTRISAEYESVDFKNIEFKTDEYGNTEVISNNVKLLILSEPGAYKRDDNADYDVIILRGSVPRKINCNNLKLAVITADDKIGCELQQSLINQGVKAVATANKGSVLITCRKGFVKAERY